MKTYPYLVKKDATGQRLQPSKSTERIFNEVWLQELLREHPEILPVAEIEPIFHPLIPIGREVTTKTGAIDNLFISHRGYLVLVETKLWRNPEAKREVVAQAIDYGSSLSKWNYNKLDNAVRAYTRKFENSEQGLVEWVEYKCGPVENGHAFFEDIVAKNLRLGRFLTLIVGDRIRTSVVEMLSYINKYPHLATDVALVELNCYQWEPTKNWPLLVVPSIVARTEIVERSVIQVTIESGEAHQVEVRQEKASTKGEPGKKVTLTEEAFWELLMAQAPDEYKAARDLVERYRENESIQIDPTESSLVVRLNIQDTGRQASLFFIDSHARLRTWPTTIGNQLRNAGINRNLIDLYESEMRRILRAGKKRKEFACVISEVNLVDFKSAVDVFIKKILVEHTE